MVNHGLVESGFVYEKYEEHPRAGMRLGRNQWLDGRSLSYMVENNAAEMSGPLGTHQWERALPILDQGELGSCTGNAGIGALATQPFYDAVGKAVVPTDLQAAQEFAIQLYSEASKIDAYPGNYPPDDTGSSGLAVCKALKARGTIAGYRWARSPYGFLRLLQAGPVLQGMPWFAAFFQPDSNGFIDAEPAWTGSGISGGHEVQAVGVEIDDVDAFNSVIIYANSWGPGWGDGGYFRMRLRTYEKLHGVDLKQFVV